MDLRQIKLTKSEWESIEVPINGLEKEILTLIKRGYSNPNYRYNKSLSILSYMKILSTDDIKNKEKELKKYHIFLFNRYFKEKVNNIIKKYKVKSPFININENKKDIIKKADLIRIENTNKKIETDTKSIYEYILLEHCETYLSKGSLKSFYTLTQLLKNSVNNLNIYVLEFVNTFIELYKNDISSEQIIKSAYDIIEKNDVLLNYTDYSLYKHQQDIFKEAIKQGPKLIFYQAPTATGKTLTPIGLCQGYKVIFVCAAKHVGLQLARACISMEIPIGVAFGCNDSEDVRLHYYAAKEYTINKKSGGIDRVDNTVGDKVNLIVSDVHSYLHAMRYMLAFNKSENIIMYWDEPTITLDREEHHFHKVLSDNWRENEIPNIILSSATLPPIEEIHDVIASFENKFDTNNVVVIKSYECKKTIPIIDSNGYSVLPHYLYNNYDELIKCIEYCKSSETILRHFDLREICSFLLVVNKYLKHQRQINNYFEYIGNITVEMIKLYYLNIFNDELKQHWDDIYNDLLKLRTKKYSSTKNIVSSDAITLTDGPTLYLCDDIEHSVNSFFEMLKINTDEKDKLLNAIKFNDDINYKIKMINEEIKNTVQEQKGNVNSDNDSKNHQKKEKYTPYDAKLDRIEMLALQLKRVHISNKYIPNTIHHMELHHGKTYNNAFTCKILEKDVEEIIKIDDLDNKYKMLLICGIGVFKENMNVQYIELMKRLADNQSLFMIIASGDYIYGTNYQFCHGYIDDNMTQEKLIQCFGRIGRTNNQLDYSIRIRNDDIIKKILMKEEYKLEVINMNKLFSDIS